MPVAALSQAERFLASARVDGGEWALILLLVVGDRGETAASTRVAPRGDPTLPWPCGCTCGAVWMVLKRDE